MDNEVLLSTFSAWQAASGLSKSTIKEREFYYRAMLRRTGENLLHIDRHQLIEELGRSSITNATRATYKAYMKAIFTWMQDELYRPDNPTRKLPIPHVRRPEPFPTDTEDLDALLNSGIYSRNRMYVLLYSYQGFRPEEIAAVRGEYIDWEKQLIRSTEGKNGVEVWRPIHPLLWREIQAWPRKGFWFPSYKYPTWHVNRKNVSRVISAAMKRIGLIGHKPHDLRKWFITEQLKAGVSPVTVRMNARHADEQSLKFYYKPSNKTLREGISRLPEVNVPTIANRSKKKAA